MRSEKTPDYWMRTAKNDTILREMTKGLYSVVDERSIPIAICRLNKVKLLPTLPNVSRRTILILNCYRIPSKGVCR